MKKITALFLSVLLVAGALVACSTPASVPTSAPSATQEQTAEAVATSVPTEAPEAVEEVTIKFLNGKEQVVDWMDTLIKTFEEKNPGIKVEHEFQKEASNVIKVKFASGDIPDLTTVYEQGYVDQGKYLDVSNEAWWSRINPAVKGMCTDVKTGKQFRVATNLTMAGLYYNKTIFTELGLKEATTWDQFVANLEAIKAAQPDVVPMYVGGKDSWMLGHLIEFLAHGTVKQQLGVADAEKAFVFNQSDKLAFDAPGGMMETFADCILELRDKKLFNDDFLTATYDNQVEAFATGKAAMISQGMWALSGIQAKNPDFMNIGFSPYPPIIDGLQPVILSAEDSSYCITAESKNIEATMKFLGFLFEADNQKAYCELIQSPSAFTDVSADWSILKDEVAGALKNGVNIAFTKTPEGFNGDNAGRMVQDLYAGAYASAAEFATKYREAWDTAWNATNN